MSQKERDLKEKLARLADFIEEHQTCEEENVVVPRVSQDTIYLRCMSCGEKEMIEV